MTKRLEKALLSIYLNMYTIVIRSCRSLDIHTKYPLDEGVK
jgi:hypothetical protein